MMPLLYLDIETGGLTADYSLLEVAVAYADEETVAPTVHRLVVISDPLILSPHVQVMHRRLLTEINTVVASSWWKKAVDEGYQWVRIPRDEQDALSTYHTIYATGLGVPIALRTILDALHVPWRDESLTVAGKNVGTFDLPLLRQYGVLSSSEEILRSLQEHGQPPDRLANEYINGFPEVRTKHRVVDPAMLYARSGDSCLPDLPECLRRAGMVPGDPHTAAGDVLDVWRLLTAAGFPKHVYGTVA